MSFIEICLHALAIVSLVGGLIGLLVGWLEDDKIEKRLIGIEVLILFLMGMLALSLLDHRTELKSIQKIEQVLSKTNVVAEVTK